jgi:glycosyltransferase involved in cell wall biosynthesis
MDVVFQRNRDICHVKSSGSPGSFVRVLYISGNSHLRSTTSSLSAIIGQLRRQGVTPVMVFQKPGPWTRDLEAGGTRVYYHPLRVVEKSRPIRSLTDTLGLTRIIRRHHIDLIHLSEHELYPAVRLAGRWTGRPIVVTLHYKLEPSYGRWLFRSPYEPAAIQFISRAQMEYCLPAVPADRARLLMSGLDVDAFRRRGGDGSELRADWDAGVDTVVFGTASAIRPYKHIDQFVRLIGRLRDRGLNVLGMIAGGGLFADAAYQEQVGRLIAELNLSDRCRLLGNLDPLTPFLKAIDCFVSTSEWETFGMSICEAQACGKPTLAYAVGGNPEALPDEWCTAKFGDLDALEEKAARLATDAEFRRDLGARAERFVRENFDAPALAARQAAIYEEVLCRPVVISPSASTIQEAACPG